MNIQFLSFLQNLYVHVHNAFLKLILKTSEVHLNEEEDETQCTHIITVHMYTISQKKITYTRVQMYILQVIMSNDLNDLENPI